MFAAGVSAWADSETFGASNATTNSNEIVEGTAVDIAASSNPKGTGSYAVFNNKSDNGLKLRTSTALTFNVKAGYKVTGITIYAYQNNESGTITCDSYTVDGGAVQTFSPSVSIPVNVKNAITQTTATISIDDIDAKSSISFNFTNTDTQYSQIFAYIEVNYESMTKTIVNIPFTGTGSTIENGETYNGNTGSMTFSQPSGNAFKISSNYMIVGTGIGTTAIAEADRAGYAHRAEGKNFDVMEISFSMAFGNTAANKYAGFEVLDENEEVIVTLMSSKWSGISPSANTLGLVVGTDITSQSGNNTNWSQKTDFKLIFDYQKGEITCKTNNNTSGKTIAMAKSKPVVAKFVLKSENSRGDDTRQPFFSNLIIKNTEGDYSATQVNYTINYKVGNDIVKSVSGENVDGITITADAVIDGTEVGFIGNHYLITESTAPSITLNASAAENVLNVPVRSPYTATLSVTTTVNGTDNVENTTLTETDDKVCSWSFSYPIYKKNGDIYYACNQTGYVMSGSFTNGETISKSIIYNSAETDIVGFSDVGGNGTNATYSGGNYGSSSSDLAACTLNSGNYVAQIYVVSKAGNGNNTRNERVYVNNTEVAVTPSNTWGLVSCPFSISENNAYVCVKGPSASSYFTDNIDYVVIRKVENTSISVTSAGYATYVNSDYDLDFSASDIKAYKVKVNNKGVATLTQLDQVPSGTPVLLYKEGGATESIPVTTGAAAVTENDLVAGTGGAVATIDGEYTNMILNNVDGIGFYYANDQTVATNRAYLHILTTLAPDAETNARMRFEFGNSEATGIENIATEQNTFSKGIYTLSGQRVSKPSKGLYIIDGKKVMVK